MTPIKLLIASIASNALAVLWVWHLHSEIHHKKVQCAAEKARIVSDARIAAADALNAAIELELERQRASEAEASQLRAELEKARQNRTQAATKLRVIVKEAESEQCMQTALPQSVIDGLQDYRVRTSDRGD